MVMLRESCLVHFTGSSKCSGMNTSKEDMSLCRRRILSADFRLVKLGPVTIGVWTILPQQPNSVRPALAMLPPEEDCYILPLSLSIKMSHSAMHTLFNYLPNYTPQHVLNILQNALSLITYISAH